MNQYEQIAAVFGWPPSELASFTPALRRWWAMAAVRKFKRVTGGG